MSVGEQADFLAAMAKVADLIKSTQAALQRARTLCHGQIFDEVDLMSKRLYELKVKSEWVAHAVQGKVELPKADAKGRQTSDRRLGLDRRVAGMKKQLIGVLPEAKERKSSSG
jgi:hypothetical protein